MLRELKKDMAACADSEKAAFFPRFFKAGPGEYAEGDVFIGVTVPQSRAIAKRYKDLSFQDLERLLSNPIHEYRLVALLILGLRFQKGAECVRSDVLDFYLSHLDGVNNWDLVDTSAYRIVGESLRLQKDITLLRRFARMDHLWKQRIAIVSTYAFIRHGELDPTFEIAEILLHHEYDLLHKAVGWMLREAGKKDQKRLESFLKQHYKGMPRTMLRYAIEKFPESTRKSYLRGDF